MANLPVSGRPAGNTTYLVQPGDTLSGISERFGSSVEAIVQANGITNPKFILAGQLLLVPIQPPTLPASGGPTANLVYTVQNGDTLSGISERFGTPVEAIAQTNGIADPNLIFSGQVLRLPTSSDP